ncbi:ATP-binding protein [Caldimonas tepidiphila]|uniref:ATP-binding protein n=1 Tax=Caldimonas tepidiphila TaxID=2315841 RepID=UPI000E5B5FA5|nr:ATP-binding protein [Caldimonas tepidiphila]
MNAPQDEPTGAEPAPQPGAQVIYRVRVAARLEDVSRVCAEVAALAAERLGEAAAGEVDLGLSEALSNIVRHGYPPGSPDADVQVVCVDAGDRWCLRVFDRGRSIPEERLRPSEDDPFDFDPERLDALPEGGMGLALLMASFDQVEYQAGTDGNLLVLSKRIGDEPARP